MGYNIEKNTVGVIDKTVMILSAIAQNNGSTMKNIVEQTFIPKSTVHRILCSLEQHKFVVKNDNGYNIGAKFIGLMKNSKYNIIINLATDILEQLRDDTKESSQLYVKEGKERVCISSIEPKFGLKNTVPVGSVFALELGSAGKVFIKYEKKPNEEIYWIESISERDLLVASVSAPVFNSQNELVAAISVSGPISRMGNEPGLNFGNYVLESAKKLTQLLTENNV